MEKNDICYCIRLRRAANSLTRLYNKALSETGLTITQYSLLKNILKADGCNKSELAKNTGLERTGVVRDLARLCEAGLVKEIPGPTKRGSLIALTDGGRAVLKAANPRWEEAQTLIRNSVEEDELNMLFGKIQELTEPKGGFLLK